jgi:hypothetical protein
MKKELVFNIWFIVDIGTELSKYVIIKPYCLDGNEEEKLNLLNTLSETDYVTSERIDFADGIKLKYGNIEIEGYIHISSINQYFDLNLDFFLTEIEKKLPPVFNFKGDYLGENKISNQKMPDEPLYALTILMENEFGEIRPYTTNENKDWFQQEKLRIDNKSTGIQN